MEGKSLLFLFSFLFLSLTSLSSSSSEQLYRSKQTLKVTPFSTQPVVSPLSSSLSSSWPQLGEESNDPSSLSLSLHHLDAFSFNSTPESLFHLRLRRDSLRVQSLVSTAANANNATRRSTDFSSSVISGLAQGSGEYFTRLGVGTPPRYLYMVLDTGSDIVWLQCSPCKKCYSQTDPVFNPSKSSSYAAVPCRSPLCQKLDSPGCSNLKQTCLYQVSYGDGSFTVGDFSTETLTFRKTKVAKVAVGCGHDNEGLFVGDAGLLGLGRGKLSFPTQTGLRFGKKFSYCLVDRTTSAKPSSVVFGESAVSRKAVFTPPVTNPKLDTFYYVGLVGISVGWTRVPGIDSSLFKLDFTGNGGVIFDYVRTNYN